MTLLTVVTFPLLICSFVHLYFNQKGRVIFSLFETKLFSPLLWHVDWSRRGETPTMKIKLNALKYGEFGNTKVDAAHSFLKKEEGALRLLVTCSVIKIFFVL